MVARRIVSFFMALFFLPAGFFVLKMSFSLEVPHIFVMFIFSGSLMVLLGLVGVLGFLAKNNIK